VRPALAAAVVLRPALLDPDLAQEDQVVEILEAHRASGARLWAHVVGFDSASTLDDGAEYAAADFRSFGMPVGGADEHHVSPKLPPRVRSIDDDIFDIEHLAAAVLAALEHAVLAHTTGARVHCDCRGRAVRDQIEPARRWSVGVVVGHVRLLYV